MAYLLDYTTKASKKHRLGAFYFVFQQVLRIRSDRQNQLQNRVIIHVADDEGFHLTAEHNFDRCCR